ncbi:hypothetical protein AVEN_240373-1 [Araneus ventricosus]|uniref:Uncharacterized protein n=1 Tax=Araneus ventricosus TaxID=182803 RepID=A0A4Y2F3V0_ARAVE|nr:hypothetical protein AVEN_240373-1 [Araneus ventricosus]
MESQYMAQLLNPPILDSVHHQGFRPLTSSSGVTGFTAQRYPSDLISLQAFSPLQLLFFAFLLPSLDASHGQHTPTFWTCVATPLSGVHFGPWCINRQVSQPLGWSAQGDEAAVVNFWGSALRVVDVPGSGP